MRSRILTDVFQWLSITVTCCTAVAQTQTTNNKQQTEKKATLPLVAPADFSLSLSVCVALKPSSHALSRREQIFGTQTLPYGQYCSERRREKENAEWGSENESESGKKNVFLVGIQHGRESYRSVIGKLPYQGDFFFPFKRKQFHNNCFFFFFF